MTNREMTNREMTNREALDILKKETGCRKEDNSCIQKKCRQGCENYASWDDLTLAIATAIEALELLVSMEDDGR